MRIYRTSTQMVPYDQLEEAAAQLAGYEVRTVLDDAGNKPPATARLVDVDEARAELLEQVSEWNSKEQRWETPRHVVETIRRLFPEGE